MTLMKHREIKLMKHQVRMLEQVKKFDEAKRLKRKIKEIENGKIDSTKTHKL